MREVFFSVISARHLNERYSNGLACFHGGSRYRKVDGGINGGVPRDAPAPAVRVVRGGHVQEKDTYALSRMISFSMPPGIRSMILFTPIGQFLA